MKWLISLLIDTLIWLKGPNFTVKSKRYIDHEGFVRCGHGPDGLNKIIEYVYNLGTMWYYGKVWPPAFSSRGAPIKKAILSSGVDITEQVLRFAGPRKNEITPCAFIKFTKRWKFRFIPPFRIQLSLEVYVEPVCETIFIETVLNQYFQVEPDKI